MAKNKIPQAQSPGEMRESTKRRLKIHPVAKIALAIVGLLCCPTFYQYFASSGIIIGPSILTEVVWRGDGGYSIEFKEGGLYDEGCVEGGYVVIGPFLHMSPWYHCLIPSLSPDDSDEERRTLAGLMTYKISGNHLTIYRLNGEEVLDVYYSAYRGRGNDD